MNNLTHNKLNLIINRIILLLSYSFNVVVIIKQTNEGFSVKIGVRLLADDQRCGCLQSLCSLRTCNAYNYRVIVTFIIFFTRLHVKYNSFALLC